MVKSRRQALFLAGTLLLSLVFHAAGAGGTDHPSLDRWLDLEQNSLDRTVDERKISAPDVANQDPRFRPDSGNWFKLKSAWIPEHELQIALLEDQLPKELRPELLRKVNGVRQYRLFIHPESEKFYARLLSKYPAAESSFEATSTASSRTLLIRSIKDPKKVFFGKLSLDVELGGVVRTVPRGEVARSVGISAYIHDKKAMLSRNFEIMPEVLGVSPKDWERGGQIVRLIPEAVLRGKTTLVPMFSLYSRNGDSTLLETLAKKAGMKPTDFVTDKILKPFHAAWADWAVKGGIVMEAHAQNFLLELDPEGNPTGRFIHRDLGGFNIDGAAPPFDERIRSKMPVFTDFETDYHQKFSAAAQDQSIGTYFEGGFLYNIDRELARIEHGYKSGEIYEVSRRQLALALGKSAERPLPRIPLQSLPGKMSKVLESAWGREPAAPLASLLRKCGELFSGLR